MASSEDETFGTSVCIQKKILRSDLLAIKRSRVIFRCLSGSAFRRRTPPHGLKTIVATPPPLAPEAEPAQRGANLASMSAASLPAP
jgi:hypothetical protein